MRFETWLAHQFAMKNAKWCTVNARWVSFERQAMELRHLRAFVAVAEELHFGRASRRLGIVQPALSRTIQALEAEVEVQLLLRSSRKVEVTPAGLAFLSHARAVLRRADDAVRAARLPESGELGVLRIGLMVGAAQPALGVVLARFRARYPGIYLTLCRATERGIGASLANDDVDAIVAWEASVPAGCERQRIASVPLAVIVPEGDPLAARASVTLADLAQREILLPARDDQPIVYARYRAQCLDAGFELRVAMDLDTISDVLALVAGGVGIGHAPVPPGLRYPGVVIVPQVPADELGYELVWMPGRPTERWVRALASIAAQS